MQIGGVRELTTFALNVAVILYVISVVSNFVSAQIHYVGKQSYDYHGTLQEVMIMSIMLGIAFFANRYSDPSLYVGPGSAAGADSGNMQLPAWQYMAKTIVSFLVGMGTAFVFVNVVWSVAKAQAAKVSGRPNMVSDMIIRIGGLLVGAVFTIMAASIAGNLVDGISRIVSGA